MMDRDGRLEIMAYCEARGIEIPSAYFRERFRGDTRRYSIVMASRTPPRLVGKTFESERWVKQWLAMYGRLEPALARFEVIDIEDKIVRHVDCEGHLLRYHPLADIEPVPERALAVLHEGRRKRALEGAVAVLFGADGLTERRKEIIAELARFEVSIKPSSDLRMVRIWIQHTFAGGLEELVAEMLDPELKTPLECVTSHPDAAKYCLATSVIERHARRERP